MSKFDSARSSMVAALVLTVVAAAPSAAQWGGGQSRWRNILDYPPSFYGSPESIRIAENVLLYQNDNGGWPKNIDMARKLTDADKARLRQTHNESETIIDNGATWSQIRFLALVHEATGDARFAAAAEHGIEFLLAAQYPNGGWPMIYPLRQGYYQHITFNDGAMIGVMNLLRDVAEGNRPFEFVDPTLRERSQQAIDKGLEVILRTQVLVDGEPTAWCAQFDETTLEPASARTYELVSLSGCESVGIVEYLMRIDDPSPEVKRAIESAVAWFNKAKIEGQAVDLTRDPETHRPIDRIVVADPSASPLWARFYEIGTNRPMYVGRDGIVHEQLADVEQERRLGYAWLGDWPTKMLENEFPTWRKKWNGE